jgi:hypothetical protein
VEGTDEYRPEKREKWKREAQKVYTTINNKPVNKSQKTIETLVETYTGNTDIILSVFKKSFFLVRLSFY